MCVCVCEVEPLIDLDWTHSPVIARVENSGTDSGEGQEGRRLSSQGGEFHTHSHIQTDKHSHIHT